MASTVTKIPAWRLALAKWAYSRSFFPQIGLMKDDTLYEDEVVKAALKRIPADVADERNFRMARALNLSAAKNILPKDEWTKWEDDKPYLQEYMEQIKREMSEKKEWGRL